MLEGTVVIVTGAGTGIGAATALELATAGCRVALVGRRASVLEQRAAELRARGLVAVAMPGDVRDYEQISAIVERTVGQFGSLDVLVANAAVVDHASIAAADPLTWQAVISTNVLGVLYSVRAALPVMLERHRGHVVVVSSVSGRVTYVGEPAYVASKHATVAFADVLRQEVSSQGIRVTVVEPGLVDTPLVRAYAAEVATVVPAGVVPLEATDCARAIRFALEQPARCSINEIVLRPTTQLL